MRRKIKNNGKKVKFGNKKKLEKSRRGTQIHRKIDTPVFTGKH